MSCHVFSCLVLSCLVLSCLVSSFLFLLSCFLFLVSCFLFLVSCFLFLVLVLVLVMSCLVLSCAVLSCVVLFSCTLRNLLYRASCDSCVQQIVWWWIEDDDDDDDDDDTSYLIHLPTFIMYLPSISMPNLNTHFDSQFSILHLPSSTSSFLCDLNHWRFHCNDINWHCRRLHSDISVSYLILCPAITIYLDRMVAVTCYLRHSVDASFLITLVPPQIASPFYSLITHPIPAVWRRMMRRVNNETQCLNDTTTVTHTLHVAIAHKSGVLCCCPAVLYLLYFEMLLFY